MYLFDLKVIVITGATSGIGKATAKMFAEAGATVLLVGRNEERGWELVDEIRGMGRQAYFYKCDVSNEHDVKMLVSDITKKYDHVDVLFNNAGIMPPSAEIENMPVEDWKRAFEVNLDGLFYVTRNFKSLIFACKGCMINNASIAGMHSYVTRRSYAYGASKAAVIQFSRQMAKYYAKDGVRVNCICPGIIDTPILGTRDRNVYAERVPLGYVGSPEDVANVVAFLASDQASYITGAVLPINEEDVITNRFLSIADAFHLTEELEHLMDLSCWEKIQNSKVLITGATGFVGYHLARSFMYINDTLGLHNVIIIQARSISKIYQLYGDLGDRRDVKIILSDLRDELIVAEGQIDYIIHAAMPSNPRTSADDPAEMFETAIAGTRQVISLAQKTNCTEIVYLSSVTIYGDLDGKIAVDEDYLGMQDWRNDKDGYMLGKRGAEYMLLLAARQYGVSVKIIRLGYIYGANPMPDNRVYAEIIKKAAQGSDITLKSDGLISRPMIYISDVVGAVFMVFGKGKSGAAYNISGNNCTIREFAEMAARCAQVNLFFDHKEDYTKPIPFSSNAVSTKKAKLELGWSCTVKLEEGIQRAVRNMKEMNQRS